jgi:hypothetical protein
VYDVKEMREIEGKLRSHHRYRHGRQLSKIVDEGQVIYGSAPDDEARKAAKERQLGRAGDGG